MARNIKTSRRTPCSLVCATASLGYVGVAADLGLHLCRRRGHRRGRRRRLWSRGMAAGALRVRVRMTSDSIVLSAVSDLNVLGGRLNGGRGEENGGESSGKLHCGKRAGGRACEVPGNERLQRNLREWEGEGKFKDS